MLIVPLDNSDLGPAVNTLAEKITGAIGALWKPLGTLVQAKAALVSCIGLAGFSLIPFPE